jgi:hypothetical protein
VIIFITAVNLHKRSLMLLTGYYYEDDWLRNCKKCCYSICISCIDKLCHDRSAWSSIDFQNMLYYIILNYIYLLTVIALHIIDTIGRRQILLSTMLCMIFALVLLGFSFLSITGLVAKQPNCTAYGSRCGACRLDETCTFDIKLGICKDKGSIQDVAEGLAGCPGTSRMSNLLAVGSLVIYVVSTHVLFRGGSWFWID